MDQAVKASVIIPTFNGAHKIVTLLDSLLLQKERLFEVIIVVDGSTDDTHRIAENYRGRFLHFEVHNEPNRGRAGARNFGASKANSPILIFYDDDMEPDTLSVSKHLRFHAYHNGIVSGHTVEQEKSDNTDIQNYKARLSNKWLKHFPDTLVAMSFDNLFFASANCSITRETFTKLDGFDERLPDAEDYDFAYRALCQDVPVYFDKTNRAVHHDKITCKGYIQRLRNYAKAQTILKNIHPERYNYRAERKLNPAKKFIYRGFSASYWPRLIDNSVMLQALPKTVRYKLYDLIIQALAIEFPEKRL